jgi:hypothetical protein
MTVRLLDLVHELAINRLRIRVGPHLISVQLPCDEDAQQTALIRSIDYLISRGSEIRRSASVKPNGPQPILPA